MKPLMELLFGLKPARQRGLHTPAMGPQFDKPSTRQNKRKSPESVDDGVPAKKKAKVFDQIKKVGPPRGQPRDKAAKGHK
jgi:hypothetical protein